MKKNVIFKLFLLAVGFIAISAVIFLISHSLNNFKITDNKVVILEEEEEGRVSNINVIDFSSVDRFNKKLVKAAIKQTKKSVIYDPSYFPIDYPNGDIPENKGVCTDVIIRAYRLVDIDLQEKVHQDMKENFHLYPQKWGLNSPDTNIDHRRVPNLQVFFSRFGIKLKTSKNPKDYKPGDIVTWDLGQGKTHIGIVTNHYQNNIPLIVHNISRGPQLENMLFKFEITGHYRYKD
nr:DUF1287 domain-containing protein [Patescibacteria group bacterium]